MRLSYKPFKVCTITGCYILTRSPQYCKYHQFRADKYGDPEYKKIPKRLI